MTQILNEIIEKKMNQDLRK